MNKATFDVLIEFHNSLIRNKLSNRLIRHTKQLLLTGETEAKYWQRTDALELAETIKRRLAELTEWLDCSHERKVEIYCGNNLKRPEQCVFDAAFKVIAGEVGCYRAAKDAGINSERVRALVKRIKHWDEYAELLRSKTE